MLGEFFFVFGGEVEIFNGVGSAFDFEYGGVVKKSGKAVGVEGGGTDDEFEVGSVG